MSKSDAWLYAASHYSHTGTSSCFIPIIGFRMLRKLRDRKVDVQKPSEMRLAKLPNRENCWSISIYYDLVGLEIGQKRFEANGPQLILLRPNEQMALCNPSQQFLHSWFKVKGSGFSRLVQKMKIPCNKPIALNNVEHCDRCLCQLRQELIGHREQHPRLLLLYLELLFAELIRDYASPDQPIPEHIVRAHSFITERPHKRLSISEIAQQADCSERQLGRLFKRYYGKSPLGVHIMVRLELVLQLLEETTWNLDKIAAHCDYTDGFALSKAFKKQYGMSPQQWRTSYIASA